MLPDHLLLQRANGGRDLPCFVDSRIGAGPVRPGSIQTGNNRAKSALACAMVTPGFSRAMP